MQLDRVGASIASFDLLYLPELRRRGVVAPSVDRSPSDERRSATVQGGALLDPQPGIFSNVAVFDFKSLYPSLIRTFHLDPLAHARAGEGDIEAPNGARFSRGDAILPEVIERFMERRELAKSRGDRHADQAIKIMMNALFGVLGAAVLPLLRPGDRQRHHRLRPADPALDAATPSRQQGVRVLYGDTDSVFVQLSGSARGAEAEAEALRSRVQQQIASGSAPSTRWSHASISSSSTSSSASSCPRCAAARGAARNATRAGPGASSSSWASSRCAATGPPWPAASSAACWSASSRDEEILPFVKELLARLRAGELDAELVYVKRVRKGSLDRYTATTPPHVQAARKAGGRLGPRRPLRDHRHRPRARLPGPRRCPRASTIRHYVERVLRPVAEAILAPLGHEFDEALGQPRQLSLL